MYPINLTRLKTALAATLAVAALAAAAPAAADWTPDRPLRIVSPYAAAGTNDLLARLMAQKLGERLGKSIVVENRAGANGIIGAEYVAKMPGDGYTMLMGNSATHGINPNLYAKLSYDADKDFTPIGLIASVPLLLVVGPKVEANSLQDLIALGKSQPGQVSFASSGVGSSPQLAGELFKSISGLDIIHVPYKGDSPALTDVLGGQVTMMFANIPSALPMVRAGKLKALAMTGAARTSAAPEIPTMAEAGLPGVEISAWYGLMAPAGLPPAVLARLNAELNAVLQLPDVQTRIRELGAEPSQPGPPAQFQQFVDAELAKYGKVIKTAGIAAE
ncbi:tripartite tricarboxylate transporter substrate binding protein [Bordetella genomosp. 6]|uniref:tripartite tricarboxylate transporter substrate binding protein n=1 Tax=Bordetella genomosp. 6 TaxID=463024 RepID=UPI000A28F427|nr:tripartite tricarboxylate transporter substrate binding protein [Bordetella genomosp. 6]ARP76950.1 LacI family transcriptional regulator [Bordetella genomosp. 6]MBN3269980.1 tripartite tricarboxylate transporter substrate binding protein [Bordetella bronchiseptica]